MRKHTYTNFGGPESENVDIEQARVVVMPICYEQAPSYGTGSREGPHHILEASMQLEGLDEETGLEWGRMPMHTCSPLFPPDDPAQAVLQMKAAAEKVFYKKKFLLALGGDHAVSLGPIMAASAVYPDLGVVQVDAHLDLRDEWNGSSYNHACVMRRVVEDLKLPVVPVGTRAFSAAEAEYARKRDLQPFYAHQLDPSDHTWMHRVTDRLPEHVYLTIDLDGLDPAVVPGTGTPEPGGLSYRQLVQLIKAVGARRTVVGADVVELTKIEGTQVSEYTAAKIVSKILVYCLAHDTG